MSNAPTPGLEKAQRIAATAQALAVITLIFIVVNIVYRMGPPVTAAVFDHTKSWREHTQAIGLVAISLLPTFLFYEAVNQLRRALNHYRDGRFYSEAAASRVAQAGDYAIGAMVAIMLVVPNLTLWVSQRGSFGIKLDFNYIGMLAFALFIAAVGRILAAAAQLKTENDSFV